MALIREMQQIDIAARYRHIRPVPRMPNFAAWIEDLDLTQPFTPEVEFELRQALDDFEVIFFRPQTITPQQHVALARVFGPVSQGSFFDRMPDVPELEMIVSDRKRPPAIDSWHTDISWREKPPLGTAIQITEIPPYGGNTCWVSTSKAFEWLSPGMQAYLETLSAVHTWEKSAFREALGLAGEEALVNAIGATGVAAADGSAGLVSAEETTAAGSATGVVAGTGASDFASGSESGLPKTGFTESCSGEEGCASSGWAMAQTRGTRQALAAGAG